jgi:hypothetical protein
MMTDPMEMLKMSQGKLQGTLTERRMITVIELSQRVSADGHVQDDTIVTGYNSQLGKAIAQHGASTRHVTPVSQSLTYATPLYSLPNGAGVWA